MKILAILGLLLLVVVLQVQLWSRESGIPMLLQLQQHVEQAKEHNRQLVKRNQQMMAEVNDLRMGSDAVEERARNELGMIKDGEIFFRIVEPENKQDLPAHVSHQ